MVGSESIPSATMDSTEVTKVRGTLRQPASFLGRHLEPKCWEAKMPSSFHIVFCGALRGGLWSWNCTPSLAFLNRICFIFIYLIYQNPSPNNNLKKHYLDYISTSSRIIFKLFSTYSFLPFLCLVSKFWILHDDMIKKTLTWPWLECCLIHQKVAGLISSWDSYGRQSIDVFLSLCVSFSFLSL